MPVSVPEVLARMRLFDGLNADELAVAEKLVFVNRAAAGDTVCREGDRSDFLCFVVRGRLDILKAQNVATARAMRRAIRAAGINLFKAHKRFMETGEVAEGNTSVELEKELKNARGREIHALKDEWGHNEEDYRKFIKNLFGSEKTSSLHLSDIEKSQLVTTYKGMISARNKANSDTAKIAA